MTTSPSDDRAYIGIDPGKKGAVVILTDGITAEYPTPLVCRKHHDPAGMAQLLRRENIGELWRCAALEKVHAMPGQGVTSMFSFGTSWGIWQGILAAMKIPYILVGPVSGKSMSAEDSVETRRPGRGRPLSRNFHNSISDRAAAVRRTRALQTRPVWLCTHDGISGTANNLFVA